MAKKIIIGLMILVAVGATGLYIVYKIPQSEEELDPIWTDYPSFVSNVIQDKGDDFDAYYNTILLDEENKMSIGMVAVVVDNQIVDYSINYLFEDTGIKMTSSDLEDEIVDDMIKVDKYIAINRKFPTADDVSLDVLDYSIFEQCYKGMNIPEGLTFNDRSISLYKSSYIKNS